MSCAGTGSKNKDAVQLKNRYQKLLFITVTSSQPRAPGPGPGRLRQNPPDPGPVSSSQYGVTESSELIKSQAGPLPPHSVTQPRTQRDRLRRARPLSKSP
eukprot:753536-Hanusia_phi.AAC.11